MIWCMRRTNIYLADEQSAALEDLARARGISRAELIRQFIDQSITTPGAADLEADLAAIRESFGVLRDDAVASGRRPDARARHLERVASR
jgi:Ribbon-helix-helix protein, copG family